MVNFDHSILKCTVIKGELINIVLIVCFVLTPKLALSQLELNINYSHNKDFFQKNRERIGIETGYVQEVNKLLSFKYGLNLEFVFRPIPKNKYYDNYEVENLDSYTFASVEAEKFLVRKYVWNSIFFTPTVQVRSKLSRRSKLLSRVLLYTGIQTRILIYDKHKISYVRYDSNLEVENLTEVERKNPVPKVFNWYVPLGIQIRPFPENQLLFDFSYEIALKKKGTVIPWRSDNSPKYNNIKIGVGYFF